MRRRRRLVLALGTVTLGLAATLGLAGCAQVPEDPDERAEFQALNDPLEPMNRQIFDLNMALDKAIMKPVATFYRDNIPEGARRGVHNVLNNMREPLIGTNDLLQGQPHRAADTFGRFAINSTFGLFGVFDVIAADGGPKYHGNDFGVTLAVWGLPEGPFLMIPFYGPSNPRDAAGKGIDWYIDPTDYALQWYVVIEDARTAGDILDGRTQVLDQLDDVERNSLDFYSAIRSLSRQQREGQIRAAGGGTTAKPLGPVPVVQ